MFKTTKESMMSNLNLLDAIVSQSVGVILRNNMNEDALIDHLKSYNTYRIESSNLTCEVGREDLLFYYDYPEEEVYNCSIPISKAKDVFKIRINEIHQNENIMKQLEV